MSEKTREQLEAEIRELEGDIKKRRDKDTWAFRAAWKVTYGLTSGLAKLTWALIKIPFILTKPLAEARSKEKERIRKRVREQFDEERARAAKLAELKKQLKESSK